MPFDFTEDDEERRFGRLAGIAALGGVGCTIGALIAANSNTRSPLTDPGTGARDVDRAQQLTDFADTEASQVLALALRCTGVLLTIAVGVYLFWLLRRRGADVPGWVRWTAVVGPVLVVAAAVVGFLAFRDVAESWVAGGGGSTSAAERLIEGDAGISAAGSADMVARIVFATWVGLLSARAMHVELLTSFLGYWGMATAGALVILPIGDAMFIGWLASVGFLALGYWPGGRPPAWNRAARVTTA